MPNLDCYKRYVKGWESNEGGVLIDDPRLRPKIIPALESEEVKIGSFPNVMAEVLPDMFLNLATIVAVWEEKRIAIARMYLYGVIDIYRTRPVLDRPDLEKRFGKGTLRTRYVYGHGVSYSIGVYTRANLDSSIQQAQNGYFPAHYSHPGKKPIRVTGCVLYIHSRTE